MALRVHPQWPSASETQDPTSLGRHENDIAVLRLARPVPGQTPVEILPVANLDTALVTGTQVIITGYGARGVVTFPDGGSGSEDDGDLYIAETPFVRRSGLEFLVGGTGSPDTCEGDSGGPGYVNVQGTIYLIGATARSRADAATLCGSGGIFTLVPAYAGWIAQQISALGGTVSDGGTADAGVEPDAGTPPEPDAGTTPEPDAGTTPEPDAGTTPAPKKSGCGCQSSGETPGSLLVLAMLLLLVIRRWYTGAPRP